MSWLSLSSLACHCQHGHSVLLTLQETGGTGAERCGGVPLFFYLSIHTCKNGFQEFEAGGVCSFVLSSTLNRVPGSSLKPAQTARLRRPLAGLCLSTLRPYSDAGCADVRSVRAPVPVLSRTHAIGSYSECVPTYGAKGLAHDRLHESPPPPCTCRSRRALNISRGVAPLILPSGLLYLC